ncbi:MAG TPA: alpha-amylase family glycosyl hydrolase [Candidatus Xenobia bacterium]|jgi:1,4-alpha-glucan branching enzyme
MKTLTKGLLGRRTTHFLLWRPGPGPAPVLHIGTYGNHDFRDIALQKVSDDVFEIPAAECGLKDGQVYHYWFRVKDTDPYADHRGTVDCTDPIAWTVDRRLLAPVTSDPAAVTRYVDGHLQPSDPDGRTAEWHREPRSSQLPPNNRIVMYELPTRWVKVEDAKAAEPIGNGTFQDVLSLVSVAHASPSHPRLKAASSARAHIIELGVNALELLPPADNPSQYGWGYGTSSYFAPAFFLGTPDGQSHPSACHDLAELIGHCHQRGIRFIYDAVMAFCRDMPYRHINFADFLVQWGSGDPEQGDRDGFGGDLFRFDHWVEATDPLDGERRELSPARQFLKAHIAWWIDYYHIDGIRMDSVNNIANWDFVQEFKDFAWATFLARAGQDAPFIVVGEELSVPVHQVHEQRLDGLWNEPFKGLLRGLLVGESGESFQATLSKVVDCRTLGFSDGTQAVNYITSHDTGGDGNERIYNYLDNHGVVEKESRLRLAFAVLLTAVGMPMILAGDEFGDIMDVPGDDSKEIDPVGFERLEEPWRAELFADVSRLVRLRTVHDALAVNDTEFIHWDDDQNVAVYLRGTLPNAVAVVVNFSDFSSDHYDIPAWPEGLRWFEVLEEQWVERCTRIEPWSARVYVSHRR